ncbi:MAG: hypothetical protein QHC67_16710 [Sphingobium sp.]|uniref:hypothetical protein n=1 Tax=Sphingobium sp. TaxID=1912891 RepID=UPI0029B58922|nr:hypothetical protein [Sphingobium sp.]MDX3911430.1 hypothetical protein [Sphingobium sp.]
MKATYLQPAQRSLFWTLAAIHWTLLALLGVGALLGFIMALSATYVPAVLWQVAGLAFAHLHQKNGALTQGIMALLALSVIDALAIWILLR